MKLSKTGQMEMIGLVVVVILITLGMLFMAKFALDDEPTKKIFVRKGLAYGAMGALMKTQADCEVPVWVEPYDEAPVIGEDLIEDCAENKYVDYNAVSYPGFACVGNDDKGMHSCDFLEEVIWGMLNDTLGKWNKHYEFRSELVGFDETSDVLFGPIKDKDGQGCPGERDTSGLFPINTDAGLVENILYVCD